MKALALAVLLSVPAAAETKVPAPASKEASLRELHARQSAGLRRLRELIAGEKSERDIKRELASLRETMEEIRKLEPDGAKLRPLKPLPQSGEVPGDEEEEG
jgi:hypothetical protein